MRREKNITAVIDRTTRYGHVLLLDDNPLDNFVNKNLIEKAKFAEQVTVHEHALHTIDFLKDCHEDDLPEIIFLDINMPGMDGFEFLDEFAKLPIHIVTACKIIMLSTSESFKDLNRANRNRYVYKFLNKPMSESVLMAINL
ncbi:MAG TPA: response regulator [Bacteroidia bacterium]|nr:response regulator [Bacteroidia bacterium]HNT79238.1 response regulator [Bacteroidia bacterium]